MIQNITKVRERHKTSDAGLCRCDVIGPKRQRHWEFKTFKTTVSSRRRRAVVGELSLLAAILK